ncbi:fluoride efflux transporter CrcB [Nakamurella deserti]|uniref:fluoride efflux transporter CrcB n=1 Tax=Nakamurella deserti TaxID=2164074 RepID=UPI000DBE32C2|nr:fluoride efflux transporter CrcB [Nakamurella deserti]
MTYLWVALGAAIGAPLRYLTDRFVTVRVESRFPVGTLVVNVAGSLILGLLAGAGLAGDDPWQLVVGTGFCGALTTYSTFAWETVRLAASGGRLLAAANAVGSLVVGTGAATAGFLVMDAVVR